MSAVDVTISTFNRETPISSSFFFLVTFNEGFSHLEEERTQQCLRCSVKRQNATLEKPWVGHYKNLKPFRKGSTIHMPMSLSYV